MISKLIHVSQKMIILAGLALFAVTLSKFSFATNQNKCEKCHAEVYRKFYAYPHPPFQKRECDKCHIIGTTQENSFFREQKREAWNKNSNSRYLQEHVVLLGDLRDGFMYRFRIEVNDETGKKVKVPEREFELRGLKKRQDNKKGPKISRVKIEEIKEGIFCEAVISWETDEFSTSQVEYGSSEDSMSETPVDISLVRHHQVIIYELEKGEIYQIRVKSEDINNYLAVSRLYSLEVSAIADVTKKDVKNVFPPSAVVSEIEIFRVGLSGAAIAWQTNIPTGFRLEWQEAGKKVVKDAKNVPKEGRIHGLGLRSAQAVGINACYGCHPPNVLGISHPVGVYPKGTIKIPDDLPTAEGGMLTCVTCHLPHGSNKAYLARKKLAKELCQSCHGENY